MTLYFILAAGLALIVGYLELQDRGVFPIPGPWHLRCNMCEILVATPWGAICIADHAFDVYNRSFWSGVLVMRRIPGTWRAQPPARIYRKVYRYQARRPGEWQYDPYAAD